VKEQSFSKEQSNHNRDGPETTYVLINGLLERIIFHSRMEELSEFKFRVLISTAYVGR
jgi:hypothetical protein